MNYLQKTIICCLGATLTTFAASAQTAQPRWLTDTIPGQWSYTSPYNQKLPNDDEWWKTFGDSSLDSLINMAIDRNYNLAAAVKRIDMARHTVEAAKGAYFPTINLNAGYTKGQTSGTTDPVPENADRYGYFSIGASAQWEIDLFGKIRANVKANNAAYNATRAEYEAAMVALAANVAKAYINLRTYQNELLVANNHLAEQTKVLAIVEARFKAGLASMLDVTQSKIVVASTRATIPPLEAMIESTINSIALLTACYPQEIDGWLGTPAPMPQIKYGAQLGVPADLLRRRPDIIRAEYELAQYAAEAGIAKKDFLPTLSISGSISTESHSGKNLFTGRSISWEVAPTLSWTVFDGLARSARVASARAQLEASVDNYNFTVMQAVVEVQNATTTFKSAMKTIELTADVIDESRRSLDLAVQLYKKGLSPFNNVVDAQLSFISNQDSQITAQGKALTAVVNLYEALGGGWKSGESDLYSRTINYKK